MTEFERVYREQFPERGRFPTERRAIRTAMEILRTAGGGRVVVKMPALRAWQIGLPEGLEIIYRPKEAPAAPVVVPKAARIVACPSCGHSFSPKAIRTARKATA